MKVLNVDGVEHGIDRTRVHLETISEQIHNVKKSINNIISLEDSLTGKGGNAIRSFYANCHMPFLTYFEKFISNYTEVLNGILQAVYSFEPDQSGFVREQFIEDDLRQGLTKLLSTVQSITNDANSDIRSVQDLVSVSSLNDSEVVSSVNLLRNQSQETINQLHQLDQSQTNALDAMQQDISTIESYLSQIQTMFTNGSISIRNFNVSVLNDLESYNTILKDANPLQYATNKLREVLTEHGPFLAMLVPYALFPITYRGTTRSDGAFSEREINSMLKKGEFQSLGIDPVNEQELVAIENYLQTYFVDKTNADQVNYLDNWIIPNGKYATSKLTHLQSIEEAPNNVCYAPKTSNPEDSYIIAGDTVESTENFSVTGGAGWYNNDWMGLDDFSESGQVGGGSEFSLVHGGMDYDSDIIDANMNTDILKGSVETRVGGESVFGLNLPLPLAKAEAKAYTIDGRYQFDRNMPYLGDWIGGTGYEAKGSAGNAQAYAGFDKGSVGVAAKVSLAEGEVSQIIGIPFTNTDVKVTLGGSAGSVGGEAKIGKETMLDLRALFGIKLGISFE
ncbi:ribonuclease YeeF family protein [Virgibacillus sp. W0181]|uniref:ribonuclease YeeF family protein n=1 Tax=Virgibacillus sp. W0181 TaxID=3391581 RepID=UPI003F45621B